MLVVLIDYFNCSSNAFSAFTWLKTVFQKVVWEEALLCNEWQIEHGQIWPFHILANYYRSGQILELPLEQLWFFIYICRIYPRKKLLIYKSSHLGWNGKHCTLEGCPKGCNAHGQCKTNHALEWECWCDSGWFGPGCDIPMEQDCSDRKDNDQGTYYVIMKWFTCIVRTKFGLTSSTVDF